MREMAQTSTAIQWTGDKDKEYTQNAFSTKDGNLRSDKAQTINSNCYDIRHIPSELTAKAVHVGFLMSTVHTSANIVLQYQSRKFCIFYTKLTNIQKKLQEEE